MSKLLSSPAGASQTGIAVIRIITGLFIAYHGLEVFDAAKMKEYAAWDNFKTSSFMPYLGKGAEFLAGVLLILGLFTRLASLIIIGTFAYITFFVGKGKFWMDDQHPFLFAILGLIFFIIGPGAWSLDRKIFKKVE
ncbi:MAG: DoxX family protein [Ferruginibacter sp.]